MLKGQRLSDQSRSMLEPFLTSLHILWVHIYLNTHFCFQNNQLGDKYIHEFCSVVKKLPFDFYGRR